MISRLDTLAPWNIMVASVTPVLTSYPCYPPARHKGATKLLPNPDPTLFPIALEMGITQWGTGCSTAGISQVYANLVGGNGPDLSRGIAWGDSITEGAIIGGVRWVTHCLNGNTWDEFIPMGGCQNFLQKEIWRLTNLRFSYCMEARLSGKGEERFCSR